MNNNIHNISKGKAPPGEKGYPYFSVISKEGRLRDLLLQSSEVTDSSPDESGFGMTKTRGMLLLNMRDGPRGRAPAIRFAMGNGLVTLTKKSSVSLCVHSALSAVKENTTETAQHTRPNRVIYTQNPTKTFRRNCIPNSRDKLENGRLQEEKVGKDEGLVIKD